MINDKQVDAVHDFPFFGQPKTRLLICSTPRTGSTMLSRALTSTGLAGCPEEYLRHERIKLWMERLSIPEFKFARYLHEIESRRTSPNGVFALKLHYRDFARLFHTENARKVGQSWVMQHQKVILFRRRDKLGQAISFFKAVASDVWSVENARGTPLASAQKSFEFSPVKLSRCLGELIDEDDRWVRLLKSLSIDYMELWYEDMIEDLDATVRQVLNSISVSSTDLPPVVQVSTQRQADEANQLLRKQFIDYCGLA